MTNFNTLGPLGGISWGIIAGGDDSDAPQDHSGNQRIIPSDISPQGLGDFENFPFSPKALGATQFSQQSFGGSPDPGTPVLFMKPLGSPGGIILGQINSLFTSGEGGGGGGTSILKGNPHFNELKNRKLNVNGPPRIQESTDADGVKIRKIQESGEQHHLGLLEGLPLHGALFNMTGFRLPELPNIPTALQKNDGMMMLQQMQQMVGQVMSLGQMFAGLAGNRGAGGGGGGFPNGFSSGNPNGTTYNYNANTVNNKIRTDQANGYSYGGSSYYSANNRLIAIQNRVPSDIGLAIGNLAKIVQGLEINDGVSFFTGGVVHQDTYLQHAENLLCQCKSIDDLMNVLSRLQFDEELFGRDKLEDVYVTIDTSYGPTGSKLDWTGNVYVLYDSATRNAMNSFANSFTSNTDSPAIGSVSYLWTANNANTNPPPPGTPGGLPPQIGQPGGGSGGSFNVAGMMGMFGKSAQTMQELMKRLHPEGEKTARELHKKVNNGEESKKLFDINKKTLNQGNPLDPSLYTGFGVSFLE